MAARWARGRSALALALIAAALAVTPAAAARCASHTVLDDLWIKIPGPDFEGGGVMTQYDAADDAIGHLVTTDGSQIAATDDGGCTWTTADIAEDDAALPTLGLGEAAVVGRSITQVRYGMYSSTVVWALGQTDLAAEDLLASQPRVLVSPDAGETFVSRVAGLPQFGRPVAVRGAGPMAVLLFKSTVPSTTYSLWYTSDAGATWEEQWTGLPALSDLVYDVRSREVWTWSTAGLWRGKLGQAEPKPVLDVLGPVRTVHLGTDRNGRQVVTAYIASGGERFVSTDGGVTFGTEPAPEGVQSVSSHPAFPGLLAISSLATNVLIEPPRPFVGPLDYSPRDDNVSEVQFVSTVDKAGFPLYAFNALAIYLRYIPADFKLPPPPPPPPVEVDVERPRIKRVRQVPSIKPEGKVVELRPGEREVVDYRVSLPPVPTPLDVFFMTDSTGSMARAISSVQEGVQDIVDALAATGVDVNFGVADFRDYAQTPDQTSNYPYRRHRKIGPIDTELEEALEGLTTGGGTTDGDDSALEAIYQGATGAGRTDPLIARGQLIPPGEGAEFRDGSMKVILVASDDGMRHPDAAGATYPGPSLDTVRAALVERGIFLVGIEVETNSDTPRPELEDLAAATGAVAPPQGVDCDGSGNPDIFGGEPIVCDFDPRGGDAIADAFIAMLSGIKDLAAVDLTVKAPRAFVRPKGQVHFPDVNVKAPSTYTLPVEFRCTEDNLGTETPVRIGATSRGSEIVSTTATLRCGTPPPEPPEIIPPAIVVALVPPPPLPPAAPTNPLPQPNPNLNPNPQLNPNAGFAAQEDEQVQLAFAENEGLIPDEDLAMSALGRAGPPLPAVAWATAFAMTGAAAFGLHLRRRSVPAPAFDPRSHR